MSYSDQTIFSTLFGTAVIFSMVYVLTKCCRLVCAPNKIITKSYYVVSAEQYKEIRDLERNILIDEDNIPPNYTETETETENVNTYANINGINGINQNM